MFIAVLLLNLQVSHLRQAINLKSRIIHHFLGKHFWYICLLGLLASVTGGS
jgi:hypothetical protein